MCGFAGVIAWDEQYRTSDDTLRRMSAAIAHRGPDGEGYYTSPPGEISPDRPQVALAFRRLAILDPDPRSNQPFTDGRRWLVFNGEIYNFRELRAELTRLDPSYEWRTTGDTEVLLRSFAVWGQACLEHLNGMFAFAVWDERDKSLFLARDRMGQKPLYYIRDEHGIAFASELSALGAAGRLSPAPAEAWLAHYLRYGYVDPSSGPYLNCQQVLPGQAWIFRHEAKQEVDYFDAARAHHRSEGPWSAGRTRTLVQGAVERQLVSDVPLGVFLSGGIDSSVIAACARSAGALQTFSVGFDDARYDERPQAREVARHLGTDHHEFRVTPRAAEDLPKLAAAYGEPFGDSSALPTYYLARETRACVKVALSGDGGDELFGGYDRYRALRISERLQWLVPAPLTRAGARLSGGHPKSRSARLGRLLETLSLPAARRYDAYVRLFGDELIARLLIGEAVPATRMLAASRSIADIFADRCADDVKDSVAAALATDRATYLPNDLLTKVDRASMLHALEVRSPFMDHELVTFAAGLTTKQLIKGGPKRMLREAFAADLPGFVFTRRKMGFAVPIGEWFRGALRGMLRDNLFAGDSFARGHFHMSVVERLIEEHEAQRVDHSQRLYALLMLELWRRTTR